MLWEPFKRLMSRTGWVLTLSLALGTGVGLLALPRAPAPPNKAQPPPPVDYLGRPLPLDDKAIETAVERTRDFLRGRFTLKFPDAKVQSFTLAELGASLDRVHLANLVRDARDPTSLLRRRHGSDPGAALVLPVPVELDGEQTFSRLFGLKDSFDRSPSDARLDLERRTLIKEVYGRELDLDATLIAMQQALARGQRSAETSFLERRPRRLASELGGLTFDKVLGFFETPYSRSERSEARTFNLRLAASKLDGQVLMPGETFDFNEVVGPRDEAAGYKVAPVIAEGELVDGIGGGTCQVSGTLHGAAFFAGLTIVERYPHTRPSSYIKMGLDATVVYPTINFKIQNSYPFPVVLHETVKGGVVRAEVLAPKEGSTVTLIRIIDEAIAYEELERPDKDLPNGARVLAQRGMPGFKLHRYRIVRDGAHAVRERWNDVYPPTAQIVRVGTGPHSAEALAPRHDHTPEYVADELLILTQGVSEEPDMQQRRDPGRFGEKGWTREFGMPQFEIAGLDG